MRPPAGNQPASGPRPTLLGVSVRNLVAHQTYGPDFASEYAALCGRIQAQREQADRLRALANRVEEQTTLDEQMLAEMEQILGLAPQMQIETLDRRLGGRRLREIAVAVLEQHLESGREIHYRDWYALLQQAGYSVSGKDPLATFLAQIRRTDGVSPVGQRSGRYRLVAA